MKSVTKRHLSSAACILIFLSFLLNGCQNTALSDPVQVTGYKLNTYVAVSAYTTGGHKTSELKEILNEALLICDTYELMFSRTNPDSTLYKLNDGQITTVPHELGELISYGIQYADMSDGAFDITIGSVSSLWDFTSDNPAVPDDSDIQNALSYVDYTRLKLTENNDGTYTVDKPDKTIIDLGAIAKGYIADKIRNFLLEKSINRGIINLGGNVLCVGEKSSDNPFLIGIKKPFSEDSVPLVTLRLNNKSAVSSGNYERYFYQDGKLYHHILNPSTGYPYDNGLSDVTIISDASVTGDCLSTTCFALGADKGLELIESLSGIDAMFVMSDGTIKYSSGFSSYLK